MPLLEEISDSEDVDNMDLDLAEFDPNLRTAIAPKLQKTVVRSQDLEEEQAQENLFPDPQDYDIPEEDIPTQHSKLTEEQINYIKQLQVIYPCYFDINRSHKQGRRVSKEYAVENPISNTIVEACQALHLNVVHEPMKSHPQDFGNPGRVRVNLKYQGKPQNVLVDNKRDLLNKIGKYLKDHPTTFETIKAIPVPAELKGFEVKKLPKVQGFKMNDIVPLHSNFSLGHPQTKAIYDQLEAPVMPESSAQQQPQVPKLKNKYMHVRR